MGILTLLWIGIMKSMPKELEMCLYCLTTVFHVDHDYHKDVPPPWTSALYSVHYNG